MVNGTLVLKTCAPKFIFGSQLTFCREKKKRKGNILLSGQIATLFRDANEN